MSPYLLWPLSIILALFLFSFAVFIHEFGHFLAARLLGMKADVFSIGFGPALWKRTFRGTEWRISAIPFGGYVSLPQLDPEAMKGIQGDHGESLPPAQPWKRIIVAFAGPFGNLVLATVCAIAIYFFAPDEAIGASTTIGMVEPDSAAYQAGLRPGDRILSVNGNTVHSWSDFIVESYLNGGKDATVDVAVQRGEKTLTLSARLDTQPDPNEEVYIIGGLYPGPLDIGIGDVAPGSPAEQAGLRKGDIILTIDGQPFLEHPDLLLARRDPTLPLTLTVRNVEEPEDAAPRSVTLTPTALEDAPVHFTQPPVLGLNFRLRDPATQTATDSADAYSLEWVVPGSPAALAGMKPGDQVLTVNGQPFTNIKILTQREQPEVPVTLTFQPVDGGASRTLTLTPAVPPSIGIAISPYISGHMQWMAERGVLAQLNSDAMSVVRVLKALTLPKSEGEAKRAASGLGGPIMIFSIFVQVIQNGLWVCLGFLRLICVNLALLNLLPIPVLDGGHILFALYAIVRRKEPSARFIAVVTNVFVVLFLLLFAVFIYRDSMRLIF